MPTPFAKRLHQLVPSLASGYLREFLDLGLPSSRRRLDGAVAESAVEVWEQVLPMGLGRIGYGVLSPIADAYRDDHLDAETRQARVDEALASFDRVRGTLDLPDTVSVDDQGFVAVLDLGILGAIVPSPKTSTQPVTDLFDSLFGTGTPSDAPGEPVDTPRAESPSDEPVEGASAYEAAYRAHLEDGDDFPARTDYQLSAEQARVIRQEVRAVVEAEAEAALEREPEGNPDAYEAAYRAYKTDDEPRPDRRHYQLDRDEARAIRHAVRGALAQGDEAGESSPVDAAEPTTDAENAYALAYLSHRVSHPDDGFGFPDRADYQLTSLRAKEIRGVVREQDTAETAWTVATPDMLTPLAETPSEIADPVPEVPAEVSYERAAEALYAGAYEASLNGDEAFPKRAAYDLGRERAAELRRAVRAAAGSTEEAEEDVDALPTGPTVVVSADEAEYASDYEAAYSAGSGPARANFPDRRDYQLDSASAKRIRGLVREGAVLVSQPPPAPDVAEPVATGDGAEGYRAAYEAHLASDAPFPSRTDFHVDSVTASEIRRLARAVFEQLPDEPTVEQAESSSTLGAPLDTPVLDEDALRMRRYQEAYLASVYEGADFPRRRDYEMSGVEAFASRVAARASRDSGTDAREGAYATAYVLHLIESSPFPERFEYGLDSETVQGIRQRVRTELGR